MRAGVLRSPHCGRLAVKLGMRITPIRHGLRRATFPQGKGRKMPLSLALRDKGILPLRYHSCSDVSSALECAISGATGAAYCLKGFGAQLGGDSILPPTLPCTNRQLSVKGGENPVSSSLLKRYSCGWGRSCDQTEDFQTCGWWCH